MPGAVNRLEKHIARDVSGVLGALSGFWGGRVGGTSPLIPLFVGRVYFKWTQLFSIPWAHETHHDWKKINLNGPQCCSPQQGGLRLARGVCTEGRSVGFQGPAFLARLSALPVLLVFVARLPA